MLAVLLVLGISYYYYYYLINWKLEGGGFYGFSFDLIINS